MGCCSKALLKKKIWSRQEDNILINYITKHGAGQWRDLPKKAGLKRCGKSCRFRWLNYLRPDIKRGSISPEEEDLIMRLHRLLGNRWSLIAGRLPGRTDNEIKNLWNTRLKKRLLKLEDTGQDTHTNKLVRPKAVRCIRAINIPYPQNPHSHEVVLKKKRVEDDHQIARAIDEHMNDISAEYWVDVLMGLEQDGSCSKVVHVPNSQDPHGIFFGEHLSTHDLGFGNEAYGANMVDTDSPNLGFWRDENDDDLDDIVLSKEAMDFSALLSSFLN